MATATLLKPGTPGTVTSTKTHGNDHHWIPDERQTVNGVLQPETGTLNPGLAYTYEPHGVVANQDEATKAAAEAEALQVDMMTARAENAALRQQLADTQAALAKANAKPVKVT